MNMRKWIKIFRKSPSSGIFYKIVDSKKDRYTIQCINTKSIIYMDIKCIDFDIVYALPPSHSGKIISTKLKPDNFSEDKFVLSSLID